MSHTLFLYRQALALHRTGDSDAAEPIFQQIIEQQPDHAEALYFAGKINMRRRKYEQAIDLISRAVTANPDDLDFRKGLAGAWFHHGTVLESIRRPDLLAQAYRNAIENDSDHFGALENLGCLLSRQGNVREAAALLRRALTIKPDSISTTMTLANVLETLNELEEALRIAEVVLAQKPAHQRANLLVAILDRRAGRIEESRLRLKRMLARPLRQHIASSAWFHLGQACDRLGRHDEAHKAFVRGNETLAGLSELRGTDPDRYLEEVARNSGFFTPLRVAAWPVTGMVDARRAPVFFVGFPRSGTTLMEEILDAHPRIATTHERSPLQVARRRLSQMFGASNYPDGLDRLEPDILTEARGCFWDAVDQLGVMGDAKILIDKQPLNIVELGLAARLFPNARIVVALRDPRDVVLSCFMQEFEPSDAMANFTTLENTARLYGRVMDLWLQYRAMPELHWMEYKYEDLVATPVATTRAVIEFIGENWSKEMMEYRSRQSDRLVDTPSREAVSEPINMRAVGRWRAYERHLASVLPILAPYVSSLGYGR